MCEIPSSSAESIDLNSSQNGILPDAENIVVEAIAIINSEPGPSTSRSIDHNNGQHILNGSENDLNHSNKRARIDKS